MRESKLPDNFYEVGERKVWKLTIKTGLLYF